GPELRGGRFGHEDQERGRSACQQCRADVDAAYINHRIRNHETSSARRPSLADAKSEVTLGTMRIHGQHTPDHLIGSGRQRFKRHTQLRAVAYNGRFADSDSRTLLVTDLDRAEGWLELLREPEHHLFWRLGNRAANLRHGVVELSVREGSCRRCEMKNRERQ